MNWAVKNIDGAIALILAVAVAVLGLLPDNVIADDTRSQLVSGATLAVLALVTTTLLRDRVRQEPVELAMQRTSDALAKLQLNRLDELEQVLTRAQRTLEDMSVVRIFTSRKEIAQAHAEARRGTTYWAFKGGHRHLSARGDHTGDRRGGPAG
ncbi:hypothetical protein [Thermobispora bispora]|uniref:hypothetical protein n=1 Tax=Thermobispora bispora TaxID=2006 RepID=UPI001F11990C|nr:hypothetical protein [Thermobispora bispora]